MDKKPVLFYRVHEWGYEQFLAGCLKELETIEKRVDELEAMTDEAFHDQLKQFGVKPLRNRTDDLDDLRNKRAQILLKDLEIKPEEYEILKQEANADAKKMRDLAIRGMSAIEMAKELEAYDFWSNAHPNQMAQLPLKIQIFDFDTTDLHKIKTVKDLRQAVQIVRKHFPDFKIKRVVVKENTKKFQAYIYYLKKVWTIAKTLSDMHKAGIVSAIT